MKNEYDNKIQEIQDDQNMKIKQLIKEFNGQLAEKDRDFQDTFSKAVGEWDRKCSPQTVVALYI